MEFSPSNNIVKRCLEGMAMEAQGNPAQAGLLFIQAWNEATGDFEKFLAAHYVARHQTNVPDKLKWHQRALQSALKMDDAAVLGIFPTLYTNIAQCYEYLNDFDNVKKNHQYAHSFRGKITDNGPFYHGTKADLHTGDLLTARGKSNYKPGLTMNHIYFTAMVNGAGLAASLAKGDGPERVYIIQPTGAFENDPNVTDKKFPGNLTRSYRSQSPLKIIGEITDWTRQISEQLEEWRKKLADNKGEIIN